MGVKRNAPGAPPRICVSVGPTSPGMALTLLTRGAQSETSGTRSLSSSMSLQTSAVGEPGVQVWGTPATQLLTVRWQAPTPHVVVPRLLSIVPSVVVDAVADLGRGGAGCAGLRDAGDAVVDGALAGADAARGGAEIVVDRAVAVVVDAVADLGRGSAGCASLRDAGDAVVDGALAGADTARGG